MPTFRSFLISKVRFLRVKMIFTLHPHFFAQVLGQATDSPQVKTAFVLQ
jgi:hypothetical protein